MRVGQARRRDAIEPAVIAALRKLGVIVKPISAKGIPDLLCYHAWTGLFLVEAKAPTGTLTKAQTDTSAGVPFYVARTPEQAVQAFWKAAQARAVHDGYDLKRTYEARERVR